MFFMHLWATHIFLYEEFKFKKIIDTNRTNNPINKWGNELTSVLKRESVSG